MLNLGILLIRIHTLSRLGTSVCGNQKHPPGATRDAGVLRRSHISATLKQSSRCLEGWWARGKKCAPMPVPVDIVRAIVNVCARAMLPRGTSTSSFPELFIHQRRPCGPILS
eukprot:6206455-Pleurochrysis_carterae.AAC.3